MSYKYIYSEQGEKEAVIIPISEWEKITGISPTQGKELRLTDMIGAARGSFNSAQEIDDYLDKLREEWD